jgi:protein phosphatase
LLWEYARIKGLDPDDVEDIPANVIHRCLGPELAVNIDLEGPYPLTGGDIFLLCSDGLSGQVTDTEIAAVATQLAPTEACRFLVDLANLRGGPDNITIVIVRIKPGPEANGMAPESVAPPLQRRSRLPWWVLAFVAGMGLSSLGAWLTVAPLPGGLAALACGAVCIFAGLVGLWLDYRRESLAEAQRGEDMPRARIHRRQVCRIEPPLVEKLLRAVQTLKARAEEKNAGPDWNAYQTHLAQGDTLAQANELPAAFREYCLAMLPLTRALSKLRNKEEVFQPVWDKPPGRKGKSEPAA